MNGKHTLGEAQALGLRLFLEGLEVPVISATIDINEGAAAVAQLEIVGLDSAMRFKPRTVVHLFFFDGPGYKYGPRTEAAEEGHTQFGRVDDRYRLLFMGELFSYTYQKSGAGARSVVLNCIDFSNYWDTSFIFQVSGTETLLDIPQIQPFITGSDVFVNNTVEGNIGLLIGQLGTESGGPQLSQSVIPSSKVEFLSSLMGILELLGGVSVIDDSKPPDPTAPSPVYTRYSVHGGMSPWHTISERRIRLLDQIATDDGKTAAAIFKQAKFEEFLLRRSDLTNSVLSFRDILNLILGHVYYSSFPNPCGRLLPKEPLTFHGIGVSAQSRGFIEQLPYTAPTSVILNPDYLAPGTTEEDLEALREQFQTQTPANLPQQLSQSFTFNQLTTSGAHPNLEARNRVQGLTAYNFLQDLCLYILEPIKSRYPNYTMRINSGFRGPELNNAVGGSETSQHTQGQAADLDFGSPEKNWEVFKWIAFLSSLPFGDVIFERSKRGGTWVHVSLGKPWASFSGRVKRGKYDAGTNKVVVTKAPASWDINTPLPP